ncbi:MAG: hypothetical protein D6735_10725 [Acidobacteria bacterium]|nr:MAG: hypothetical protein D6735_10725 [Acidobacteriota bacterium]
MLHEFQIKNTRLRLWQKTGESYDHILMKALGYAMFVDEYPNLQVEAKLRLRYAPDLLALDEDMEILFWGECGQNSIRKTHWILKHTRVQKFVLFKIGFRVESFLKQIRDEITEKYRPHGRFLIINFVDDIVELTSEKRIDDIPKSWFSVYFV